MSPAADRSIEHLNSDCACVTLDNDALRTATERVVGDPEFRRNLSITHPHLLSAQPLFLSPPHADSMRALVAAIETVAHMPAYQEEVLAGAPEIARYVPGARSAFMGYDFHIGPAGPKLIEINTNAGGALLNAYLLQAQRACCPDMAWGGDAHRIEIEQLPARFVAMFKSEWALQRSGQPLASIAIVDQAPQQQYLYPEFVLFQRLFQAHGLIAIIAAPHEFTLHDGALWHGEQRIDLVYNRLTDFELAQPESRTLREAYLANAAVVTPTPRAHALLARKTNLAVLSDAARLRGLGIAEELIAVLVAGIPRTEIVRLADPGALWARRNGLFFKPSSGFGSKATYRGDKITRKVWDDILAGDYVAQEIVAPSTRTITIDGQAHSMKADIRCYVYDGQVSLMAARIYQGQTTNFRTPGGGFSPVFVGEDRDCSAC